MRSWSKQFEKRSGLFIASVVLLMLWAGWWASSLWSGKLHKAKHTWVPAYDYLGIDFLSNYYSARHWLAGGDPYVDLDCDPVHRAFCYPPLVLPSAS